MVSAGGITNPTGTGSFGRTSAGGWNAVLPLTGGQLSGWISTNAYTNAILANYPGQTLGVGFNQMYSGSMRIGLFGPANGASHAPGQFGLWTIEGLELGDTTGGSPASGITYRGGSMAGGKIGFDVSGGRLRWWLNGALQGFLT